MRCRSVSSLLPAIVIIAASSAAVAQPIVWTESSLVRIREDAIPGTSKSITIYAAKGESESFQLAIHAAPGSPRLTEVKIVAAPFVKGNDYIPEEKVVLYREWYHDIPESNPGTKKNTCARENKPLGKGRYPDALAPLRHPVTGELVEDPAAYDVVPGHTQTIWVDVNVPRTAVAGTYEATFHVRTRQGQANVTATLVVWNFALPLQPALKSSFLMEIPSVALIEELLRHRLMPKDVPGPAERRLIDELGLNIASFPCWGGKPPGGDFKQEAAKHQRELPLYCYSIDEISEKPEYYATVKQWGKEMHEAGIDQLVTMKPHPALYNDGSARPRSAVDIWVVLPFQYDQSAEACRYVQKKGDQVWSYNTLVQDHYSPKWHIDFAPINFRIHPGFISQSLGLTGLLYWRVDYWKERQGKVWEDAKRDLFEDEDTTIYPGDGVMVYPGARIGIPGVAPSMRLKWLRDGVDDFDYIELLKKNGRGDLALSVSRFIGPDWCDWTRDPAQLELARRMLGEALGANASAAP